MDKNLWQTIGSLAIIGIVTAAINFIAHTRGYYIIAPEQHPSKKRSFPLSIIFLSFVIFFGVTLLLSPAISSLFTKLISSMKLHEVIPKNIILNSSHSIALFLAIFLIFIILTSHKKSSLNSTLKDYSYENCQPITMDALLGIITWLIAFPLVSFVSQFVELIVFTIFNDVGFQQNAIIYLKQMKGFPIALVFTTFTIVFLAPLSEELIFRGLLQTWFSKRMGRLKAIALTSIIFAAIHFSNSHGLGNISLLASLFTLSCYLGFIYERQRSLISPILLHATFNSISVIRVLVGG
ncbi:MAG: CPBP family intramembrane metalloprotease [Rhabdochlamydiaceae bacterium]|nr:CPBP family intramembrane metalloprotease [Candidatus Amphrikana amoebophyrae]